MVGIFLFQIKEQFLMQNVVRIRDIELLTGLEFLSESGDLEAIRTRVLIPDVLW